MLGYGDVDIMSAATDGDTLNRFVSHPKELYTAVITAQEEYKQVKANSPRTMGPDERTCPYCAEFIKKQAVFCKHCRHELLAADNSSNMKATAINEGGYDMPPDNALNRGGNPIPPMPGPSAQVIPSQSMKSAEPEASSTPEIASAKDWLLGSNDTRDTASHMEARIAIKPE
jgi:hypothetical protein